MKNRILGAMLDRRTFLISSGIAGAALALPQGLMAQELPVKGGRLVLGLSGGATTDSLDPALSNAQVIYAVIAQFAERMIMVADNGRDLEPRLVESWSSSPDFMTWSFKVRKGVTFHNGNPLTAKDTVFSLNRHRGPNSKSGASQVLKVITEVKVVDDHEFSVSLSEPNSEFPFLMADYHIVVQPDGDNGKTGIGTGPYVLVASEVRHGVRYITQKYKDYWQPDVGHVDSIETLVINDNSARVSALLNGQVHIINRVEPKVVSLIGRASTVKVVPTKGRGHYVFAMRCDVPPFDNADLRMALKLAINREDMVKQILRGYGSVGNDTPVNETYPFSSTLPQRTYNPEEAAKYYKKSGHTGPIVLHTSDVAFAGAVDAAVLFQEQARRAGITIEVKREPGDGYWDNIWNKAPFSATYWDGRPTQDQMLAMVYASGAAWNETAWNRPEFDNLLSAARKESDPVKRTELYKQANSLIRDDGGAIISMFTQYLDGVSNKVKGFIPDINNELSNARFCERCWLTS